MSMMVTFLHYLPRNTLSSKRTRGINKASSWCDRLDL